jgi:hypothetical protein
MGDESLIGIVDLVHGEKDPRNLMLVFSILKVIMVEWNISNHAQVCPGTPGEWTMTNTRRLYSILCIITSLSLLDLHPTTHTELRRKT